MTRERMWDDDDSPLRDAGLCVRSSHSPWRRAVAAAMAMIFLAALVLIGFVCTTDGPRHVPSSFRNLLAPA